MCPSRKLEGITYKGLPEVAGRESLACRIEVVTPIFGGGFEIKESNGEEPIRVPEIRGHLRFWWRATRGAAFADAAEMCQREQEIWGGISYSLAGKKQSLPSKVNVEVREINPGSLVKSGVHELGKPDKRGVRRPKGIPKWKVGPGYALFPLRKEDLGQYTAEVDALSVRTDVSFTLCLTFPRELKEEVEAALKAWVAFGGYGARTRRGLGTLQCQEFTPILNEKQLTEFFNGLLPPNAEKIKDRHWPTLKGALVLVGKNPSLYAKDAWETAVERLQYFRQGENVGRDRGHGRPGRSRWPEADSLKKILLTRDGIGNWAPHEPQGDPNDRSFPRVDFGLPILLKFKDRDDERANASLTLRDTDRLASPLIVKCLPIMAGNGQVKYSPMILLLDCIRTSGLDRVKVEFDEEQLGTKRIDSYPVPTSETRKHPVLKVPFMDGANNALIAFTEFFKDKRSTIELKL